MEEKTQTLVIKDEDIDNILDEIEENEKKQEIKLNKQKTTDMTQNVNWDEITQEISNGNVQYFKTLITSKDIKINAQNPLNGKTLLIYSVIIGNFDLVKVCCNFGADVHIKDYDGDDALDYAIKYGRYRITELVYYRQLSGSLGNDLKNIANDIRKKTKEAESIMQFDEPISTNFYHSKKNNKRLTAEEINETEPNTLMNFMTQFMIKAIKERLRFDQSMMFYVWYNEVNNKNEYKKKGSPLQSELWQTMMTTYQEILCDTSDKNGWKWLKNQFISSLIWYLPHPNYQHNDNNDDEKEAEDNDIEHDEMEVVLKKTLFYELLNRVRNESKHQSDKLLKEEINKIKTEKTDEWNQLISYNVHTKFSKNSRQDVCGCIISKYTDTDLSEDKYPPSTHFSAKKHYDTNIYLNELLFRANIMDNMFQTDMRKITKEISLEIAKKVLYRAGPVKTLKRSQVKVENDYINEDYPTSARILDINRCALQFESTKQMMKYIDIFSKRIQNGTAYCIVDVIRCKNGWSIYNEEYPQYTDIKLNVLIQSKEVGMVIAEVQLLLNLMSSFKKKAHKLYGIERKFELIYNFGRLRNDISKFKDVSDMDIILRNLAKYDDIKYWKSLWNTLNNKDSTILIAKKAMTTTNYVSNNSSNVLDDNALFQILLNEKGEIHKFLMENFQSLYFESILKFTETITPQNSFAKIYDNILLNKIGHSQKDETLSFLLKRIFEIAKDKRNVLQILAITERDQRATKYKYNSFMDICSKPHLYVKSLKEILKNIDINDEDSIKYLLEANNKKITPFQFACKHERGSDLALEILKFAKNKRDILLKILTPKSKGIEVPLLLLANNSGNESGINATIKCMKLILSNSSLNRKDSRKLILNAKDKNKRNILTHLTDTCFPKIFKYLRNSNIVSNGKSMSLLIKVLNDKDKNQEIPLMRASNDGIVGLLKYLKRNDEKLLNKLIEMKVKINSDYKSTLEYIFEDSDKYKIQQCLFSSSMLNDKEICNDIIPVLIKENRINFVVLNYMKNDRKLLLKIPRKFIMKMCKLRMWTHNKDEVIKSIKFFINNNLLTNKEKWEFISYTNSTTSKCCLHDLLKDSIKYKRQVIVKEILNFCKTDETKFVELLLQENTKTNKNPIENCLKGKDFDTFFLILRIIKNDELISRLWNETEIHRIISDIGDEKIDCCDEEQLIKYMDDYIAFTETELDGTFRENTDVLNEFVFSCFLGKTHIIKKLFDYIKLDNFAKDKRKKISLITDKNKVYESDEKTHNALTNILENNYVDLLKLVLIDIDFLSPKEKHKILLTRIEEGDVTKLTYTNNNNNENIVLLEILNYFKESKDYIYKLLLQTDKLNNGISIMQYINSTGTGGAVLSFILNDCPSLTNENKLELLTKINNPSSMTKITLELMEYFKNDKDVMIALWSQTVISENEKRTPLIQICMSDGNVLNKDNLEILKLFLNNTLLSMDEKYKFLSENEFAAFHYANDMQSAQFAFEIFNYFKDNENMIIELLSHKSKNYESKGLMCLAELTRFNTENTAIELVLSIINKMSDKQKMNILFNQDNESGNNFVAWACIYDHKFDYKNDIKRSQILRAIISTINDNTIIYKLLTQKNSNNNKTCYEMALEDDQRRVIHTIEECLDYLKFDEFLLKREEEKEEHDISFNEYDTNPFILACNFGKTATIFKLLKALQNDKENITSLLLNNFDKNTGDYCLMILLKYGYKQIIIDLLQFLKDNGLNELILKLLAKCNQLSRDETILMLLCGNNHHQQLIVTIFDNILKECDNMTKLNLLEKTDCFGNSCFHIATPKILKYIQKYL